MSLTNLETDSREVVGFARGLITVEGVTETLLLLLLFLFGPAASRLLITWWRKSSMSG
jgi:hypothetical protein